MMTATTVTLPLPKRCLVCGEPVQDGKCIRVPSHVQHYEKKNYG